MAKEKLFRARCPIHGGDRFKGRGCEVFNDLKREQSCKKRYRKKSRQVGKKQERDDGV